MAGSPSTLRWALLLGPGRPAGLRGALAGLAEAHLSAPLAPSIEVLEDPVELHERTDPGGRLLIDAPPLEVEDQGLVRRFARANPDWEILVTGCDERARPARDLLALPGARWWSWPLDVEQLEALVAPDEAYQPEELELWGEEAQRSDEESTPAPPRAPLGRRALRSIEEDLEAIEEILGSESPPLEEGVLSAEPGESPSPHAGGDGDDPRALDLTPEEIDLFMAPLEVAEPADEEEGATETAAAAETQAWAAAALAPDDVAEPPRQTSLAPPSWYRAQVADLADLAQRLSLDVESAADDLPHSVLADLDRDVTRLTQFARTLGYLAAPPGRGAQVVALATLVEELLGGMAGASNDSPRYLFRGDDDLQVLSDKSLLVPAFDALLQLAAACSSAADVVRVAVGEVEGRAEVRIHFPAGPLADLEPAEVMSPYGLRRVLPEVGAHALAAAGRILQGQGGDLAYGEDEREGERLLLASLPLA